MEKTMRIDGMMCNHCKASVEKALSSLEGVNDATVDLEAKTACIRMEREIPDQVLMDAVAAKGFIPIEIQ